LKSIFQVREANGDVGEHLVDLGQPYRRSVATPSSTSRRYSSRPPLAATLIFNTTKGRRSFLLSRPIWRPNPSGCRELAGAVRLVPDKPGRGAGRLQVLTLEVPVGEKFEHPLFHRDPALMVCRPF
jgi:hypothetical protein